MSNSLQDLKDEVLEEIKSITWTSYPKDIKKVFPKLDQIVLLLSHDTCMTKEGAEEIKLEKMKSMESLTVKELLESENVPDVVSDHSLSKRGSAYLENSWI